MLPRNLRLVKPFDFNKVYKSGRQANTRNLRLFYLKTGGQFSVFGFVVGKKQVEKIVSRNRLKRILRNAISQCRNAIVPGFSVVIQGRHGADKASPSQLREDLQQSLMRAKLLKI